MKQFMHHQDRREGSSNDARIATRMSTIADGPTVSVELANPKLGGRLPSAPAD